MYCIVLPDHAALIRVYRQSRLWNPKEEVNLHSCHSSSSPTSRYRQRSPRQLLAVSLYDTYRRTEMVKNVDTYQTDRSSIDLDIHFRSRHCAHSHSPP
jgi:hypothetical protein